jgi:hypothetical protein
MLPRRMRRCCIAAPRTSDLNLWTVTVAGIRPLRRPCQPGRRHRHLPGDVVGLRCGLGGSLLATTTAIMAFGLLLPTGPLPLQTSGAILIVVPVLAAILLGYRALTQAMRAFYTRRFGWQ